jgi:LysM repeat protein
MTAKRTFQAALSLTLLAACLALPLGAAAASASLGQGSPCGSVYIVQPGDWLIKIANYCGVTLADLYAANPGLAYQRYIYPGQAINIPAWSTAPAPLPYVPPPGQVPPPTYNTPSQFYYPNLVANPHVGGNYYASTSSVGVQIPYQITVFNNGNTPLEITGSLTPPSGWDVDSVYDNCPDLLGAGRYCTLTWLFTPRVSGYAYIRVYVRGHYTDSYGYSGRVTGSPAFLFVVNP